MPKVLTDEELAQCKATVDKRIDAVMRTLPDDTHELHKYYTDTVWRAYAYGLHQAVVSEIDSESDGEAKRTALSNVLAVSAALIAAIMLDTVNRFIDPGAPDFLIGLHDFDVEVNRYIEAALAAGTVTIPADH